MNVRSFGGGGEGRGDTSVENEEDGRDQRGGIGLKECEVCEAVLTARNISQFNTIIPQYRPDIY